MLKSASSGWGGVTCSRVCSCINCTAHSCWAGAADLRRIRNSRGLKPSQCARLEGHHDIARLLHAAPPPPGEPPASPTQTPTRNTSGCRAILASLTAIVGASLPPSQGCSGSRFVVLNVKSATLNTVLGCVGVPPRRSRRATAELRAAPSLEALMQLLVARAKLLLSLRSVVQAQRTEQVQLNLLVTVCW